MLQALSPQIQKKTLSLYRTTFSKQRDIERESNFTFSNNTDIQSKSVEILSKLMIFLFLVALFTNRVHLKITKIETDIHYK